MKNPWLISYRPDPDARLRLFCFHYAGGGAHTYQSWAQELPRGIEVYGVQQPGRGARMLESPLTHYQPLIRSLSKAMLPLLNKPFAFFGHSMGALVSFETARLLRRERNLLPVHLFLSGRGGPRGRDVQTFYSSLSEEELIEELLRFNGAPQELLKNPELMRIMLPTIRADFAVCETYQYLIEPSLPCPITVFGGIQDDETSVERLAAWRDETSHSFSQQMFPGGHFFLYSCQTAILRTVSGKLMSSLSTHV